MLKVKQNLTTTCDENGSDDDNDYNDKDKNDRRNSGGTLRQKIF